MFQGEGVADSQKEKQEGLDTRILLEADIFSWLDQSFNQSEGKRAATLRFCNKKKMGKQKQIRKYKNEETKKRKNSRETNDFLSARDPISLLLPIPVKKTKKKNSQ